MQNKILKKRNRNGTRKISYWLREEQNFFQINLKKYVEKDIY